MVLNTADMEHFHHYRKFYWVALAQPGEAPAGEVEDERSGSQDGSFPAFFLTGGLRSAVALC